MPVLDATPAGAAVYRRSGFVPGFEFERWERPAPLAATSGRRRSAFGNAASALPPRPSRTAPSAGAPQPAGLADLDALLALDRAATGLDRRFLLSSFLARPATRAWRRRRRQRLRHRSCRPARDPDRPARRGRSRAGRRLLDIAIAAATAHDGGRAIFIDVPRAHRPLADRLERQGFVRQRPFVRMALGATEAPRLGTGMFALAGPEFG